MTARTLPGRFALARLFWTWPGVATGLFALGFVCATALGVAVRMQDRPETLYSYAGIVWVSGCLAVFAIAFSRALAEGDHRDELRIRMLPGGRAEAWKQWASATLLDAAWPAASWIVYLAIGGPGLVPIGASVAMAAIGALALALAGVLGTGLGILFPGPYGSVSAAGAVIVTMLAFRGTSLAAISGGWISDAALSASAWCAADRALAQLAGLSRPGLDVSGHVGVLLTWIAVAAGILIAARSWQIGRVTLSGSSVRQRRLRQARGY